LLAAGQLKHGLQLRTSASLPKPFLSSCGGFAAELEPGWKNTSQVWHTSSHLQNYSAGCADRGKTSSETFAILSPCQKATGQSSAQQFGMCSFQTQLDIVGRVTWQEQGRLRFEEKKKIKDGNIFACLSSIRHFISALVWYFQDASIRPAKVCFWHRSGAEFMCRVVALLEYRTEISDAPCHLHISCTITLSGNLNCSFSTAGFQAGGEDRSQEPAVFW